MQVAALAASVWQKVLHTDTFPTPTWERVVWQISCGGIRSRCAPFRRGVLGSHELCGPENRSKRKAASLSEGHRGSHEAESFVLVESNAKRYGSAEHFLHGLRSTPSGSEGAQHPVEIGHASDS